jgi:hypothetical protein
MNPYLSARRRGHSLGCMRTRACERYDKCRSIQIGVPTGDSNIVLARPRLNVK